MPHPSLRAFCRIWRRQCHPSRPDTRQRPLQIASLLECPQHRTHLHLLSRSQLPSASALTTRRPRNRSPLRIDRSPRSHVAEQRAYRLHLQQLQMHLQALSRAWINRRAYALLQLRYSRSRLQTRLRRQLCNLIRIRKAVLKRRNAAVRARA